MNAVIVGAGIAGLALAQRLRAIGWDVVVIEKAQGPRAQGYMLDFFGPGYDAAEVMGVLPRLKELAAGVAELTYLDEAGRRRAGLNYARFQQMVGGRLLSIMRPDVELALREQALRHDVDLRYGRGITQIERSARAVRVALTDGTTLDADLLVGADGIHSTVRRMVFGEETQFLRYLGFHTAAYIFDDPQIHRELDNRFVLTDTMGRQMGFYALRDGRVAAFAVHRTADPTLPDDPRQALVEAYATLGWIVPRALAKIPAPPDVYYDTVAQVEVPQWSRGRVTLVGDANQAVSLLGGQGASLAVAGAYVLGEHLATADSVDAALARYQHRWQPLITRKQEIARRGAQWFLPTSPLQLWWRRAVITLTRVPGLARWFGAALVGKPGATIAELAGGEREPVRA